MNELDNQVIDKASWAWLNLIGQSEGASAKIGQITFSATQNASSDVNTLDDYEEGAWTPNQGAGLTVVGAFSSSGTYTKIGNIVNIFGYVQGATSIAVTAGGIISSNLPFTVGANMGAGVGISSTGVNSISIYTDTATTQVQSANALGAVGTRISFSATFRV